MIRILLVGKDFRLLATRAGVLSRTGASTVCCSPAEMKRDLAADKFDVVVLCHSLLPGEVSQSVASLARRWWPKAKILLLRSELPRAKHEEILRDKAVSVKPIGTLHETLIVLRSLSNHHIEELLPPSALVEG